MVLFPVRVIWRRTILQYAINVRRSSVKFIPILGAGRIVMGAGLVFAPNGLARGLGIKPHAAQTSLWLTRIDGEPL